MTALDAPGRGGLSPSSRRGYRYDLAAISGSWTLAEDAEMRGAVELLTRQRGRRLPLARPAVRRLPLVAGTITVDSPLDRTVGEFTAALGDLGTAQLTISDLTTLGNRRYALDLFFSNCGPVGPDEAIRLEGSVARDRDDVLRIALNGVAPIALGGAVVGMRLNAAFSR
jgi:hypothetical protein